MAVGHKVICHYGVVCHYGSRLQRHLSLWWQVTNTFVVMAVGHKDIVIMVVDHNKICHYGGRSQRHLSLWW